ncbi:hypothetical protein TRAPUB_6634 [Trametes pubescens]|uniref:Uncharacterized protein n=1 Tax=Trametes pubescens TaxID=154538 RepID=A0A1M2V5C0_TRAPU|nr:hypothetical protein TRAPUB_6634 [Trametes pubescens]
MLPRTNVGGGGMEFARGRGGDGGRKTRLFVVKSPVPGRRLPLLLRGLGLPDPSCVLRRDERELPMVRDDMGEIGGDLDGLVEQRLLGESLGAASVVDML